jgi:hypothetical protein
VDRVVSWRAFWRGRFRTIGIASALLLFAIGLYFSARAIPDILHRVEVLPFVGLVILGAPVSIVLSAIEMHAVSRIAGGPMSWRTCFEVTVYSSAANMLPLPGGAMAKLAAMKSHGVNYRTGSAMVVLSFAVWGSLAFLYSSTALVLLHKGEIALVFAVCSITLMGLCWVAYSRISKRRIV